MYLQFYGLNDYPFALTPDPAFLYLSGHHREALSHLLYGTGEHGGFVQLTGEVGTGKTTLIRALLEQDHPELDVALCLNPQLTVTEFVAEVCDELGVHAQDNSLKALVDALNAHLLETHSAGRRTVLIVDEAQNLNPDVLEQLRLLTNLETRSHKLMRIMLVGQPELETLLQRPDLRQLAQRITARYHLRALNRAESITYIRHRIQVAGGDADIFSERACSAAYTCSGGVPRLINTVCERALMGGYSLGSRSIGPRVVRRAAGEALPDPDPGVRHQWRARAMPAALLAAVAIGFGLHYGIDYLLTRAQPAPVEVASAAAGALAPEPADSKADSDERAAAEDAVASGPGPNHAAGEPAADTATRRSGTARPAGTGGGEAAVVGSTQPSRADRGVTPPDPRPQATDAPGADPAMAGSNEQTRPGKARRSPEPEPQPEPRPLPEGDADMAQLLRLWGVFGQPDSASCWQLVVGDLHCVQISGTLADLELFNRPALLEIRPAGGETRHVVLSSLTESHATLVFASGVRRISRERLKRLWTGDARLIWRQPIPVRNVRAGSIGSGVVWVRRQLARERGVNLRNRVGKPSPVYDQALAERIRRFQRRHDMKVDGVVGPRTIMALNRDDPAPGTPVLMKEGA